MTVTSVRSPITTEVRVDSHNAFYWVAVTGLDNALLHALYGETNAKLAYGWEFETAWGKVSVTTTNKGEEWNFAAYSSGNPKEAVKHTLALVYDLLNLEF